MKMELWFYFWMPPAAATQLKNTEQHDKMQTGFQIIFQQKPSRVHTVRAEPKAVEGCVVAATVQMTVNMKACISVQ